MCAILISVDLILFPSPRSSFQAFTDLEKSFLLFRSQNWMETRKDKEWPSRDVSCRLRWHRKSISCPSPILPVLPLVHFFSFSVECCFHFLVLHVRDVNPLYFIGFFRFARTSSKPLTNRRRRRKKSQTWSCHNRKSLFLVNAFSRQWKSWDVSLTLDFPGFFLSLKSPVTAPQTLP